MVFSSDSKIPVGISACLTGQPVRFNGGHKRSRFCTDTLSNYFDFRIVCPEVAIGMGTPREPIRLVSDTPTDTNIRAVGVDSPELDVTDALKAEATSTSANNQDLCGFIFMQKSPSCGVFAVKRYLKNGHPEGKASGIFANEIARLNPLLPIEEAGRLNDATLRENFMVRVFAFRDWQLFRQTTVTPARLIEFHSRYKYLVMAHSIVQYKAAGKLLSDLSGNIEQIANLYFEILMTALAKPASRKLHTNTMMHLQGYLKKLITPEDREELQRLIMEYRRGIIPLIVPLTLLKHHLNHFGDANRYAREQVYLNPHPYEMGLRNSL